MAEPSVGDDAPRLFGTDGIRGLVGEGPLRRGAVCRVGRAVAAALLAERGAARAPGGAEDGPPGVLIGRDTRPSGGWIAAELALGLERGGARVSDLGVLPSPAVSLLVRDVRAALGVVLSASHNPPDYNGVKLFGPTGQKASNRFQREVERRYAALSDEAFGAGLGRSSPELAGACPSPEAEKGSRTGVEAAARRYEDALVAAGGGEGRLDGVRLVCDAAFGAAYQVAPRALRRLGARVETLGAEACGDRINDGVGAVCPEAAQAAVRETGAQGGVAFDGDADRVVLFDETGRPYDGDAILFALACALDAVGELPGRAVVATVMSNLGLERALRGRGIRLVRTPVGDRHVTAALLAGGFGLGGEQSGHIVLPGRLGPTGDGPGTACVALRLWRERAPDQQLSAFLGSFPQLPQEQRKIRVAHKPPLDGLPGIAAARAEAEAALGDAGRVLLRYSGTEPVLRLLVEHEDAARALEVADRLEATLRALPALGASA